MQQPWKSDERNTGNDAQTARQSAILDDGRSLFVPTIVTMFSTFSFQIIMIGYVLLQ